MLALVGEGAGGHLHAQAESARAAPAQGGQERVLGESVRGGTRVDGMGVHRRCDLFRLYFDLMKRARKLFGCTQEPAKVFGRSWVVARALKRGHPTALGVHALACPP